METDELKALLEESLSEFPMDDLEAVVDYAAASAAKLALLVGQPGFHMALIAERDSVALFAGVAAVDTAKVAEARLQGFLQGALSIGAKALIAAV